MTEPRKVSILDLTVDQVEQIEIELGKPVDAWTELPSRMKLYRRVYAIATGTDDATVGSMTMKQLTDSITLDDEDAETANPTEPAPPAA